ncbi:Oidioi.mRNA.OKI2018_I69.chr2.g6311.t1.cds [Oikopleura dioica]|uniref:glutaminase n=1 Tax=Oikopleura dioica TaxID=34765 RepID=A0ABN7T2K8_OIKDI|nr:Oidioi.mRNA.OKI2018_I69.chr2.g6311.t1.cds [Oikopleura dioica]
MTLGPAKRKRILTKFRKVVLELGRQRLGRDLDMANDGPVSLLELKKRDSTQTITSTEDVLEEFREMGRTSSGDEEIERMIFDRSKTPQGNLDRQRFIRVIRRTGLQLDDPRLYDVRRNIDECHDYIVNNLDGDDAHGIDFLTFRGVISNSQEILYQAIQNQFEIADFPTFLGDIRQMYDETWGQCKGDFTTYTQYLKEYHCDDEWAVSFCSVDGQRCGFGSKKKMFTMQALMNPFLYAMSLDELGHEKIHAIVGQETSGGQFNVIKLDDQGRPHNPMGNAGAILLSSLYKEEMNKSDRHGSFLDFMRQVAGIQADDENAVSFDYAAFMSEREDCHRNSSISYYLREKGCIASKKNVEHVLDVYTQMCNVTVNCDSLSVLAATLANGGICPITGQQCFSNDSVKSTLSCMLAAGMNDHSGIWAFEVGLPAKSGISGGTMIIIPNFGGFALYSPKIDKSANSIRALEFAKLLNEKFHFHEYDPVRLAHDFSNSTESETVQLIKLMVAAETNDPGYEDVTCLHLAAARGHVEAAQFLINKAGVPVEAEDQYGRTPMDYAIKCQQKDVIEFLRKSIKIPSRNHSVSSPPLTGPLIDDVRKKAEALTIHSEDDEENSVGVLDY